MSELKHRPVSRIECIVCVLEPNVPVKIFRQSRWYPSNLRIPHLYLARGSKCRALVFDHSP
jgi:hypothetical protein